MEEKAGICYQVVVNGFTAVRCFLTGTDESNIVWLERKKNTVLKSRRSSLRCGLEAEAAGSLEPWQEDEELYVIRGGGYPIWRQDGTFVGALCISGLHHEEDHRMAAEAVRRYAERRKETVSYTHLDVYKRQQKNCSNTVRWMRCITARPATCIIRSVRSLFCLLYTSRCV